MFAAYGNRGKETITILLKIDYPKKFKIVNLQASKNSSTAASGFGYLFTEKHQNEL